MNVLIITIGSRGDIQPFIALAKGLQAAGHAVALCTAEGFRPWVEQHGVTYAHMNNEFLELMESKEGKAATETGGGLSIMKRAMGIIGRSIEDQWVSAQALQPDVIIYHPKALGGLHIAEKLGVPAFLTIPLPLYTPTSAFPAPIFGTMKLGAAFNRFTYTLMGLVSAPYAGVINNFRVNTLGLPKRGRFANDTIKTNGQPMPMLYPFSREVVPVPADYPPHAHVTGYWFLDQSETWQPPNALSRFLTEGTPPVYVGFGSMSGTNAAARAQIVLDALAQSGQRGVLASGWGGLQADQLRDDVYVLDAVPHDWLFPQVSAVVHHGGAGTTAAGLRAGKPSVIVPFIADQPFWGRRVRDLGVGPAPIPQKQLTVAALADAISTTVNDATMRNRAAQLGEAIRAEDGVARAVEIIERAVRA